MQRIQFHQRLLVVADSILEETLWLAGRAAESQLPVLIRGESGTGKELIARYIHEKSGRRNAPFVSVNCAAIPEGLLEAELFGYERGAFTGAVSRHLGKFEQASGGTILLDELSEMPFSLQAKLLRVLQEGEVDRLGGVRPVPITARIIATTNRDPLRLIEDGLFRQDLYFRLNVIRIDCQKLRNRKVAIQNLAKDFLRERAYLSIEALEKLCSYSWPGNVRELQNAIERALIVAQGNSLEPEHFVFLEESPNGASQERLDTLASIEQQHILSTLKRSGGNRTETARSLGISIRTLRNKLKAYREGP